MCSSDLHKHVHLSVAVGADDGLVVPVVRNVDVLSVPEISAKMKDLAARAKSPGTAVSARKAAGFFPAFPDYIREAGSGDLLRAEAGF